MENENNDGTRKSRQLLLLLHCYKDKIVNDVGVVKLREVGEIKQFLVISIPDFFDVKTPASEWGKRLSEIRNKYVSILSLAEKDRLEIKVL